MLALYIEKLLIENPWQKNIPTIARGYYFRANKKSRTKSALMNYLCLKNSKIILSLHTGQTNTPLMLFFKSMNEPRNSNFRFS